MKTITFYSYKGGVGRTLAASNFGVYLAKLGKKVILADFDLDAPAFDSKFKFSGLKLHEDQKGLLDYILDFQTTGRDDNPIENINIEIPIVGVDSGMLQLIPAGYYRDPKYSQRLSSLNWHKIFLEKWDGVAFFQLFLKKIKKAFNPDFLIVDSRTGISEIAGVCTQQLADEVVFFCNFSSENLVMTKHLVKRIQESKIAKMLKKKMDVKIVVSRIPTPDGTITDYQETYSLLLDRPDRSLSFLFSSRELEKEEFIAMAGKEKRDPELTEGYRRLLRVMNIDVPDTRPVSPKIISQPRTGNPRICLIYTGGTIGMIQTADGTLSPPEDPSDFLKLAPELSEFVDLEFLPLLNKDSTNITPEDWQKMAEAVYERRNEGFQGFVIAHGTDTMHFSASAVAFALGPNLNFPVVFTGAQTVATVTHGDARVNLVRACRVALQDLAEVVISFDDNIFRGCRTEKKDEKSFDAFESPAFHPVGSISGSIELTVDAKKSVPKEQEKPIDFQPGFASGILQVSLIPGLESELILPAIEKEECNGVILQSFGAGNVPDPDEKKYSFIPLIVEAVTELNKPVIVTSQFPGHSTLGTEYEVGRRAHEKGAIPIGNMTSTAASVKFRWVLAQVNKEIAEGKMKPSKKLSEVSSRMNEPYVGEMDQYP